MISCWSDISGPVTCPTFYHFTRSWIVNLFYEFTNDNKVHLILK